MAKKKKKTKEERIKEEKEDGTPKGIRGVKRKE